MTYLWAVYVVFLVTVLVWALIIALKLARFEREVGELAELARERQPERDEVGVG